MIEKYFKSEAIESNREYKFEGERLDIFLSDTIRSYDKEYTSQTSRAGDFLDVGFLLKDLKNTTLDFGGATIVFHGRIAPFILDNCENVTIKNLKVDYDRPFYTQARVLDCKRGEITVKIDDGFDYCVKDGYFYAKGDGWEKNLNKNDCLFWLFDRKGNHNYNIMLGLFGEEIFPNDNPPLPIEKISVEEKKDALVLKGPFPPDWDYNNGDNSLIFTHEVRDKSTVTLVGCKNIKIENFILIHGAAMGITGMRSENIYLDNYSMYRDYNGNGRLVTCNADGVHLFNCWGDFVLKNSYMDGLLDDTVNVHNNYLTVEKIEGNKLYLCSKGSGFTMDLHVFCEGQRLGLYKGRTQEKIGEYTVKKITTDRENKTFIFETDKAIEKAGKGDVVENLSAQAKIVIENCKFGNFRGTMRLQSRNKTILRNCEFLNETTSLLFTGDTTYWYESSPVNDLTIENCIFRNTKYGARISWNCGIEFTEKAKYYHKGITVKNCYFDSGTVAVFDHVDGFRFINNRSDGEIKINYTDSRNVEIGKTKIVKGKQ